MFVSIPCFAREGYAPYVHDKNPEAAGVAPLNYKGRNQCDDDGDDDDDDDRKRRKRQEK